MRLSPEEETFLCHWMYDECHYQQGAGPAKRLQLRHRAIPADLATLIAAAFPEAGDQEAAGFGPPPARPPTWPWAGDSFAARLAEARALLAQREHTDAFCPSKDSSGAAVCERAQESVWGTEE
jgi:hypothetical protein